MSREAIFLDPALVFYVDLSKHDSSMFASDDAYGRACTLTGTTWKMLGRAFNGAISTDRITTPDSPKLQFGTGDFTIGAWARNTGDQVGIFQVMLGKGFNAAGKWKLGRGSSNAAGIICYGDGGTLACSDTAGTAPVNNGAWHLTIFSRKGDIGQIDFDGQQVGNQTGLAASNFNATTQLAVGDTGDVGGSNGYWVGDIGEAFAYARYLFPNERARLYTDSKGRYV